MDRGSRARSNATAEGLERGRRAGAGETRAVGPCGVAPFGPALHSRRISDFEGDPQALQDAYHVEVQVILWDAADVLLVPSSAVYRSGNEWSVFTEAKEKPTALRFKLDTVAKVSGNRRASRGGYCNNTSQCSAKRGGESADP